MSILSDKDRSYLQSVLKDLETPVKLTVFTNREGCGRSCRFCQETVQIMEELIGFSSKILAFFCDLGHLRDPIKEPLVYRTPCLILGNEIGVKVSFYGVPIGNHLMTLILSMRDLSKGSSGISDELKVPLLEIQGPTILRIFVTPACQFCPAAVRRAVQMAMENRNLQLEVIDAIQFPELASRFSVSKVPKIIVEHMEEYDELQHVMNLRSQMVQYHIL